MRLGDEPFVGGDEESAGAAGRVPDGEVGAYPRIGLHAADDRLDEDARGEILARPLLALAGRFLQQPFIRFGLNIDAERGPFGFVDEVDEPLEVDGVVEAALGLRVDVAQHAGGLTKGAKSVGVVVEQIRAALDAEGRPITALGQGDGPLVGHLEEQQVRELFDVVAVVDAVVAERVAESPEFLYDVGHKNSTTKDTKHTKKRQKTKSQKTRMAEGQRTMRLVLDLGIVAEVHQKAKTESGRLEVVVDLGACGYRRVRSRPSTPG